MQRLRCSNATSLPDFLALPDSFDKQSQALLCGLCDLRGRSRIRFWDSHIVLWTLRSLCPQVVQKGCCCWCWFFAGSSQLEASSCFPERNRAVHRTLAETALGFCLQRV